MSELTKCCYCVLEQIKADYGADKVHVHRMTHGEEAQLFGPLPHARWETRTWYLVEVDGEQEPVASFMELTASCAC